MKDDLDVNTTHFQHIRLLYHIHMMEKQLKDYLKNQDMLNKNTDTASCKRFLMVQCVYLCQEHNCAMHSPRYTRKMHTPNSLSSIRHKTVL